ncbi:MAG TPA: hypothetical protein VFZ34_33790 [Blastocatellia bacterium]|nr:hypothetical protein [Blastocatellia bacterium]
MLRHKVDLKSEKQKLMYRLCQIPAVVLVVGIMAVFTLTVTAADGTFSLGGDAMVVDNNPPLGHPKAFELPSTCTGRCLRGEPEGKLTTSSVIYLPDHTLRFKDLHTLSTDYRRIVGDCGGGSMRWEIGLDTDGDGEINGRLFVYFGQPYRFDRCSTTWVNTGNFIGPFFEERWDLTQFRGRFYSTYRDARNLLSEALVCYIILVVDGAWFPDPNPPFPFVAKQIFQVDRVQVNNDVFRASQPLPLARANGPSIDRLNLERYVNNVSEPVNIFSTDSYLGRRYSFRSLLRLLDMSRVASGRGEARPLQQ